MRERKLYVPIIFITTVYGALFGILTNLFFDKLTEILWKPLVIMLMFVVFTGLLALIIYFFSERNGSRIELTAIGKRSLAIAFAVLLVCAAVFEILYELGLKPVSTDADSYIFALDDSESTKATDPDSMRLTSVDSILNADQSDTPYAVYTFSNGTIKFRDMLPEANGSEAVNLNFSGGTAMVGALSDIMSDIEIGSTQIYSGTKVILLSDGEATDLSLFGGNLNRILRKYVNKGIVISTVGLGPGVNKNLMERIAGYTGGVYVHADKADELAESMRAAALYTSERNLLSLRGSCKTEILHALMRIVFLILLGGIIAVIKSGIYGRHFMANNIMMVVCSVSAGLWMELSLGLFGVSENLARVVMWILLALMMIEEMVYTPRKIDGYNDEQPVQQRSDMPAGQERNLDDIGPGHSLEDEKSFL